MGLCGRKSVAGHPRNRLLVIVSTLRKGMQMTEPSSLRQYAAKCMERAEQVKDPGARAAWLQMAVSWLKIAGGKSRATKLGAEQQQQQQIQPTTDLK